MFVEKKQDGLVFNWAEGYNSWELNENGKMPRALITIAQRGSNYAVHTKLSVAKMSGNPVEYAQMKVFPTEQEALMFIESEKERVQEMLKEIWAADYVLKVLSKDEALDFTRGLSTCISCGKKYIAAKKYHRFCDACGEKMGK